MDKTNLIKKLNGVLDVIPINYSGKQTLVQIFSELIDSISVGGDIEEVRTLAQDAKDLAEKNKAGLEQALKVYNELIIEVNKNFAEIREVISELESKTNPATTSNLGIVKQMDNVPNLAGTEDAAGICNTINTILNNSRTAGLMENLPARS